MLADDIPLFEEPTHRAAQLALNYRLYWYYKNVPKKYFQDETAKIEDVIKTWFEECPDAIIFVETAINGFEEKQTLLLATNLSYADVEELDTQLSWVEYQKLIDKCRNILNGGADSFFKKYQGVMSSKVIANVSPDSNTSTKSRVQRGTGSKK